MHRCGFASSPAQYTRDNSRSIAQTPLADSSSVKQCSYSLRDGYTEAHAECFVHFRFHRLTHATIRPRSRIFPEQPSLNMPTMVRTSLLESTSITSRNRLSFHSRSSHFRAHPVQPRPPQIPKPPGNSPRQIDCSTRPRKSSHATPQASRAFLEDHIASGLTSDYGGANWYPNRPRAHMRRL